MPELNAVSLEEEQYALLLNLVKQAVDKEKAHHAELVKALAKTAERWRAAKTVYEALTSGSKGEPNA